MDDQPTIILHLPLSTPQNRMYRHKTGRMRVTAAGKRYHAPVDLSDEYKAWLDEAGWIIRQQAPYLPPEGLITGQFSVWLEFPIKLAADEDAYEKGIYDLLQRMCVIRNDKGIYGRRITRAERADVLVALTDLHTAPFPPSKVRKHWSKPRSGSSSSASKLAAAHRAWNLLR